MIKSDSDGTRTRPFQSRSYDEMLETLQKITKAENERSVTDSIMRTVKVSNNLDLVFWAQIHWDWDSIDHTLFLPQQWFITYHKTYFDLSPMKGLWKRYQYRCLSMYEETPASIEKQAKEIAEFSWKQYNKKR